MSQHLNLGFSFYSTSKESKTRFTLNDHHKVMRISQWMCMLLISLNSPEEQLSNIQTGFTWETKEGITK